MRISDWSSDVCSSDLAPTKPDEAMKGMNQASMPGMDMAPPASATQSSQSMPNMDMQDHSQHGATPQAAHAGMEMTGTALPAGDAPAPPPPSDHYAHRLSPRSDDRREGKRCEDTC